MKRCCKRKRPNSASRRTCAAATRRLLVALCDFDLFGWWRLRRARLMREQRFAQAPVLGQAGLLCLGLHPRQQQRHHAARQVGVAPVEVEGLLEELTVFDAVDEAGRQRVVKVAPAFQPRHLQRLQRQLDAIGRYRQTGLAQHAAEVHHVVGQVAGQGVGLRRRRHVWGALSRRICSSNRAASEPCTLAMSSWYFSNTPSV